MADPIIVECKAEYHGDQDIIQAMGIVSTTEGESLHTAIKEAHFNLLFDKNIQGTIPVTGEAYIVVTKRHESGEGLEVLEDELGEFRAFFSHFPRSKDLEIEWSVVLKDGRTSRAIRPVQFDRDDTEYPVTHDNPILALRSEPFWKRKVIRDYKRPR